VAVKYFPQFLSIGRTGQIPTGIRHLSPVSLASMLGIPHCMRFCGGKLSSTFHTGIFTICNQKVFVKIAIKVDLTEFFQESHLDKCDDCYGIIDEKYPGNFFYKADIVPRTSDKRSPKLFMYRYDFLHEFHKKKQKLSYGHATGELKG